MNILRSRTTFVQVALPISHPAHPLTYTYSLSKGILVEGMRVLVEIGHRKEIGVIVGTLAPEPAQLGVISFKPILDVLDRIPIFSPILMQLSLKLSSYYLHPHGLVLQVMLPPVLVSTQKKLQPKKMVKLTLRGKSHMLLAPLFGKRAMLSYSLFVKKVKESFLTASHVDNKKKSSSEKIVISFVEDGAIEIYEVAADIEEQDEQKAVEQKANPASVCNDPQLKLTEDQAHAFQTIVAKFEAPKPDEKRFLLHGITGSGKTEVYLQVIAAVFQRDDTAQVLVLVPEISLTPQMTRIFEQRFPAQVSVTHSRLSSKKRWACLDEIKLGTKRILIGPRSAVFANFANLKLIIIDEEHDQSYKQGSGFHYHARTVAWFRSQAEGLMLILGSATPSLESFQNSLEGKLALLELRQRPKELTLPHVEMIKPLHAAKKFQMTRLEPLEEEDENFRVIHPQIVQALRDNLVKGDQSIVICGRRGLSHYLSHKETGNLVHCPSCDVTLTLHYQDEGASKAKSLICHHCGFKSDVRSFLNKYFQGKSEDYVTIGYGSQRFEEVLKAYIPEAKVVRLDSDISQKKEALDTILEDFRLQKIDILLGTQILAKGHDFPKVTLVVILEIDELLGYADFRSGERAFQLVVQACGRSGRGQKDGHVLIQTRFPEHPIILTAQKQAYNEFVEYELSLRKAFCNPPFSNLILMVFENKHKDRLDEECGVLSDFMSYLWNQGFQEVKVLGPLPTVISKIKDKHRMMVLMSSSNRKVLYQFILKLLGGIKAPLKTSSYSVDVDPVSFT